MKELLEAGVHFGHQTKRWNPKMKEFIFGERNGIYIIDLGKTVKLFREAEDFDQPGGRRRDGPVCRHQAPGAGRHRRRVAALRHVYVNQRWLGGLLTNFRTIQRSLGRLRDLEAMVTDGRYDTLSKKEIARNEKRSASSRRTSTASGTWAGCPTRLHRRHAQGKDRRRRGAQAEDSVVGIVDTNCDPDEVDYVIPGNDDALRAIRLFASRIADAVLNGRGLREARSAPRRRPRARATRPGASASSGARVRRRAVPRSSPKRVRQRLEWRRRAGFPAPAYGAFPGRG